MNTPTSTQCSISVAGFIEPAHVNFNRARKGRSVVLVTINGGSLRTIGSASVDGGGSVAQVISSLLRTVDIGRDCGYISMRTYAGSADGDTYI